MSCSISLVCTVITSMQLKHIDVSAIPNANMYALMDVFILLKYTTTTNIFPGVPRTHSKIRSMSTVEIGKLSVVLDDSLMKFVSECVNVSAEMNPLLKTEILIGSVLFIVIYLCCCEERLELLTLNVGSVFLHCLSRHNPRQMDVSIIAKVYDIVWLVTKSHLALDTPHSPTALKCFVCESDHRG